MKENKNMKCDPCEQDFKHKVNELVREGHAPTHMEHFKRKHEIHEAFEAHNEGMHAAHPGGHPKDSDAEMRSGATPGHKQMPSKPAKEHAMAGHNKMKK